MEINLTFEMLIDYLLSPGHRLYLPFLVASLLMAIVYIQLTGKKTAHYFNRQIWWSESARLDYMYFFISAVIKTSVILPLLIGAGQVAGYCYQVMQSSLGYQNTLRVDHTLLVLIYTTSVFLAGDFSRYWLHRLMHRIPWLWEIHKVHHSAEVLTPVTFYRVHPLENLLFGLRYAIVTGVVTGLFLYLFGFGLQPLEILGVNVFVFITHLLGGNLRHSHIALAYPDRMEKFLISPAQHQFHHTHNGSNNNYGGVLAIWDWMFGSLRVSNKNDEYHFGTAGTESHRSITGLLISPIVRIAFLLRKSFNVAIECILLRKVRSEKQLYVKFIERKHAE